MFFTKVITAAALFASCVSGQDAESNKSGLRGLQDMGEKWRIGDVNFDWDKDNKEFQLAWVVSDAIQDNQMNYRIYDNLECNTLNGGQDITVASGDPTHTNYYLYTSGLKNHADQPHNPASDGSGSRESYLHLALQTKKLPDMTIWDPETTSVNFCVRYMLHTDASESIEVNFQEILVTLNVDLTGDFTVTGISVEPKKKNLNTDEIACNVEAYICDSENDLDASGRILNQGDEVRICVKTTDQTRADGLWLEKINYFYFYRDFENSPLPQVRQDAITEGGIMSPMGLTLYNCQPGEDPCGFDNILVANFYSIPGVGEVKGKGEAICQIGRDESTAPSVSPAEEDENEEVSEEPSAAPSLQQSNAPSIAYDEWLAVPTNEPNGNEEACFKYPIITQVTDFDYEFLLDEAFGVTYLNDDRTAVNVTLTQNFAAQFDYLADTDLHWMAMMYPALSTGKNKCMTEGVGNGGLGADGDLMTISAVCHEAFAEPVQLFVQLDLYFNDGDLPYQNNAIYYPEQCGEPPSEGEHVKNLGFTLFIPCDECFSEWDFRRALYRNGYISKRELNSNEPVLSKDGRLLKKLSGRRKLQEEQEEIPPSPPFDMTFSVDGSADAFQASSAPARSAFMSLAMTLSMVWGAVTMFA